MLKLSCLCGQVQIETTKRPEFVNECNCTLCRKTGAPWGYFHPSEVTVGGEVKSYVRQDKDDPAAQIQFCPNCGATTHFVLTGSALEKFGNTFMGVNMGLAEEADLAGLELRFPDGRAWQGAGEFRVVREPRIL